MTCTRYSGEKVSDKSENVHVPSVLTNLNLMRVPIHASKLVASISSRGNTTGQQLENLPYSVEITRLYKSKLSLECHPKSKINRIKMQGIARAIRSCQETLKNTILKDWHTRITANKDSIFSRFGSVSSSTDIREKGLENVTVADVLETKGEEKSGAWLSCRSNDTVYDAVKNMARNNIGSLVVLKPGQEQLIAGIITERDYLQKIISQGRSSKQTRVGEIMTDEHKLITVSSDTNILKAMQLMTEHHIRHVPVIDGKIVGMISIVDVVRAVVEQQSGELKRLNDFIQGEYY